MLKHEFIRFACCLIIAVITLGQIKVVTLKDGRQIKGEVTKTADGYEVKTRFGVLKYPADQVVSVKDFITPEEEYNQRLAKIDPNSASDRLELGRWALKKGMLEAAREELRAALKVNPDSERARLLLRQVEEKIAAAQPLSRPAVGEESPSVGKAVALSPQSFVSQEDIYRIRIGELRPDDNVAIQFQNDVVRKFVDACRGSGDFVSKDFEKRFMRFTPMEKANYMLEKLDRDSVMKDDIIVKSDPRFMVEFRNFVWPNIARSCASADCHGGPRVKGKLRLFNIRSGDRRVDYTNFLILDMAKMGGLRMIDRNNVDNSLLLQYSLPGSIARFRHPKEITTPTFRDRNDRNYQRMRRWIESLRGPLHPNYRTSYVPSGGTSSPVPAAPQTPKPEPKTAEPTTSSPSITKPVETKSH